MGYWLVTDERGVDLGVYEGGTRDECLRASEFGFPFTQEGRRKAERIFPATIAKHISACCRHEREQPVDVIGLLSEFWDVTPMNFAEDVVSALTHTYGIPCEPLD